MQTDPTPDFDLLAKAYRWLEYASFGRMLERCRLHFLPTCVTVRRALVLGDGDGRFTRRLLQSNPLVEIDAVDASVRMLQQLHQRAIAANSGAVERVRTIQTDIRSFTPDQHGYDLVVSHFFLDCLTQKEVDGLADRLHNSLAPNARWLISDFAIPERGWRRFAARLLIRALYFAFFLLTKLRIRQLPNYASALEENRFVRLDQKKLLGGLLITELWQVQPPTT
jgi:cyclopropane fatty-acyl-phospholipid synthase-like methyltransferase